MGSTAKIVRERTVLPLPPSLKVLWDQAGREAPELSHAAMPEVLPHTAASDQVPPKLGPLTMARNPAANPSPPMQRKMPPHEDEYMEVHEGNSEVLSNGQAASDGDEGLDHSPIQNTLSGVSHVFGVHEETDIESDHEEKIQSAQWKWHQPSPKEDMPCKELSESSSEEEQPTNKALCN